MAIVTTQYTVDNGLLKTKFSPYNRPPEEISNKQNFPRGRFTVYADETVNLTGGVDSDQYNWRFSFPEGFAYEPVRCHLSVGVSDVGVWTNTEENAFVTIGGGYEDVFESFFNTYAVMPVVNSTEVTVSATETVKTFDLDIKSVPRAPMVGPVAWYLYFLAAGSSLQTIHTIATMEFDVFDVEQVRNFPVNMTQRVV